MQSGKIDTCFIDLNHAQELRANIAGFNNRYGNPNVVSGKYEDKIEGLLSNKRGVNVFLYIDPYGIKALDSALFGKFEAFGLGTLEMLINFNSFGFFRDACRVMSVDYQNDEAIRDLDDLVEYEPTPVHASKQSEELLISIAGGDYWKAIVLDYQAGRINGYQAERRLSTEYKQRLRQRYRYVLDMPIRLKAGQRPKYRMIHACDHEDGCFLMAQNMQKRKDELFINVQQDGQLTLFDIDPTVSSTVENELMTVDQIKAKLKEHLSRFPGDVGLTKALHDKGCKTWVSVEPYPTPNLIEQNLNEILEEIAFTDKIIFGRTNYSKEISAYTAHRTFYNEQAEEVIAFCKERNIQFHIKAGTIRK